MKEEWLFPGATVPVDVGTTAALVNEIKRLIGMIGEEKLAAAERERRLDTLHAMYQQACQQRDELMDQQRAQIEALRGRIQ